MCINYDKEAFKYLETRYVEPNVYIILVFLLEINKNDIVLDFGCGTGNYLKEIHKNFNICAYGIDSSKVMCKIAQENVMRAHILNGNHTSIPFRDNFFTKVYCTDVIHHITELDTFLKNILKVVTTGARFCICTESTSQLKEKYWNEFFPSIFQKDLIRFHSIEKIVTVGEKAGWKHLKTIQIEEVVNAPITTSFFARIENKSLSVLHLIPQEEYEKGVKMMKEKYEKQLSFHQQEGYTFILFEKGE